ncbi:uncharacterized protein LY89DRAFT_717087 [Mollisia scopiformis]|uniref:Uncharacterized protein n=1 Tax=Mollisia scopiformis TaxID=149040 RepID=A0A194XE53_MOLSC|nr:uncharacterized protein LY89DRAFT_717087 [Mollisia scopiformis]KUJ18460.1 hypothetical protein LY89DRAFT_717087 [Mollisia scopiformis]
MSSTEISEPEQQSISTQTPPDSHHHQLSKADSLLKTICEVLREAEQHHPHDVNEPSPGLFKAAIDLAWETIHDPSFKSAYGNDPAAEPLFTQLRCTLKHIRFTFSRETQLYVHDDVLRGHYAFLPSCLALEQIRTLLLALQMSTRHIKAISKDTFEEELHVLKARHKSAVASLIKDPLLAWQNFRTRLRYGGDNASFPELRDVVRYLDLNLHADAVVDALYGSCVLFKLHEVAVNHLSRAERLGFPCRMTVDAVENAVAFLDIYARSTPSHKTPPLYHSHRYQYYAYFLKAQTPDHILLPIFEDVGATALIAMRGVPIGLVGAHPDTKWVDGFYQTPLEFWYHDVNHSRRMFQFFKEHALAAKIDLEALAEDSHNFIKHEVLPLITIKKIDSGRSQEEQADAEDDLLRDVPRGCPSGCEELDREGTVACPKHSHPIRAHPGWRNTSHLAGNFYDVPDDRQEYICITDFRTQKNVAAAGNIMAEKLGLNVGPEINAAYAHNDAGLPDDFHMEVEKFMVENPSLMVPLSTALERREEADT